MLGLGLSLQKGISAFNAGRALVSSYIRRVTEAGGVLQNTACDAAAINELNQDRLLEPASWVLVPDGIEEDIVFAQKPTSGLGDLTFTRASDATYTDSTGVVRRSPYNLARFSEMFTDATWGKNALGINTSIGTSGIQANVATAPNGTLTADRVNFNLQSDLDIGLNQAISEGFAGQSFVGSVYVKGEGSNIGKQIKLRLKRNTGGSFVAVDTTITLTSDWVRITPAALTLVASNTGLQYIISSNDATNALIWGTQVNEGTSALDYFPTTNRQDVPRIDFRNADGTLSSCGRLLLEPQRTNSIRNSSMVGAVAGTPGTLPTNWTVSNAGLTQTIVGVGTELGLPYVDIRLNGTASGAIFNLFTEGPAQVVASNGQTWTNALYMKTVAAPNPYNSILNNFSERTAAGALLTGAQQAMTLTSTLTRFSFTRTNTNAATERINAGYQGTLTIGAAYDFTIRIAAPQMELGSYATTWVPTTTAAVTRLADLASKTGVSSLIGQTEGTLFVEVDNNESETSAFISLSNAAAAVSNHIWLGQLGTNIALFFRSGGVYSIVASNITSVTGVKKIALAYGTSFARVYVNGTQVFDSTAAVIPSSMNKIEVNNLNTSIDIGRVSVLQAAIFTTRLTNSQLQSLTTL